MQKLPQIMEPLWGSLIVEPDKVADVVGVVIVPEMAKERSRSGVIRTCAKDSHPVFSVGRRVVFGPHSGQKISMGGDGRDYLLMRESEVLMLLDGEEDEADLMGESWAEHLAAPPGKYLLHRAAMPTYRGSIIVPPGVNLHTRSAEAELLGYTPQGSEDAPVPVSSESGDPQRVFLAGTVAKKVSLGRREDVVFWTSRPDEIAAILHDAPSDGIETADELHLGSEILEQAEFLREPVFDEGSPEAPR